MNKQNSFKEAAENELIGKALDEVAFVHDYVQLRFDDVVFSLYGSLEFDDGDIASPNDLVSLIGRKLAACAASDERLRLHFEGGRCLTVSWNDLPELAQYNSPKNVFIFN